MKPRSFFLFKPDGIGDFFLATGVVRLLAREIGEENLTLAVLPIMESVVRGQFPKAQLVTLPLRTKRVLLNKFLANCLRCFFPWLALIKIRVDVSISLRNMRDYLQTVLFFSVRSPRKIICSNPLLQKNRPIRRWTEAGFQMLFHPLTLDYPDSREGVPSELEAHRLLLCQALQREVAIEEIWPELRAIHPSPLKVTYWVCAPFSSGQEKDYPLVQWVELFLTLHMQGKLPSLALTGSPDQENRLEKFHALLTESSAELGKKVQIILPKTLQDFIDLLAAAQCVTTVDTAAAHAATALDNRTLVLFSGKHQGMFAPWTCSAKQRWVVPSPSQEGLPWYTSYKTEKLLKIIEDLLTE